MSKRLVRGRIYLHAWLVLLCASACGPPSGSTSQCAPMAELACSCGDAIGIRSCEHEGQYGPCRCGDGGAEDGGTLQDGGRLGADASVVDGGMSNDAGALENQDGGPSMYDGGLHDAGHAPDGSLRPDSGVLDGGFTADGGVSVDDAGLPPGDGGPALSDGGPSDGGTSQRDAGATLPDAGVLPDGGVTWGGGVRLDGGFPARACSTECDVSVRSGSYHTCMLRNRSGRALVMMFGGGRERLSRHDITVRKERARAAVEIGTLAGLLKIVDDAAILLA
jgi:hypothetical protein